MSEEIRRPSHDTVPIDRAELAERLRAAGHIPDDVAEVIHEAAIGPRQSETLNECIACASCAVCGGTHTATPKQNTEWLMANGDEGDA